MSDQKKVLEQSRWSLADLYPSGGSSEMEAAIKDLETRVTGFEKCRENLVNDISAADFMAIIKDLEDITKLIQRLGGFAELWFAEDTQNQAAQSLVARMEQMSAELSNRVLFFNLWWKALDEKEVKRLMAGAGDYCYWLEEMRHFKPYTLTEAEVALRHETGFRGLSAGER